MWKSFGPEAYEAAEAARSGTAQGSTRFPKLHVSKRSKWRYNPPLLVMNSVKYRSYSRVGRWTWALDIAFKHIRVSTG